MRRSGFFIALLSGVSGATACPLAAGAQQPAVCGRLLPALRHCLRTTGHIEGERGRAVFRILFGCLLASGAMAMSAAAENAPGVTDAEIKIGQTMPYTGPGAWFSSLGLAEKAYLQMINDQGGINGRKINLISVDKPIFFMSNISVSVPVVLQPAGLESSIGLLSSTWTKDPLDPEFENDPGMKDWRAWMSKYLPGEDVRRPSFAHGYNSAAALIQVLKQAGNDLSRENIMRQATNLRDLELPMLLPGIKVNTSPTDYWAVQQLQLTRFDGKRWVRFGDLVYDE